MSFLQRTAARILAPALTKLAEVNRELAREQLANVENQVYVKERLAELELALEDVNWARLVNEGNRELSRDGLKRIMAIARLSFLKNPLINRAVTLQAYYVWGQGVNLSAVDVAVNDVIQEFMEDPKNQVELTSHQARTMKEMDLQVTGNLFFVFFVDTMGGGNTRLRSIPADEVAEIITNPEDMKEPWFYKRIWNQATITPSGSGYTDKGYTAYYPDWRYKPAGGERLTTIGGHAVKWDAPVYHMKVGGLSDMRFGVPEVYAALDWAKSYKEFLEDWATIVRAYARFAWDFKTKGGDKAVQSAKTKMATTLAASGVVVADTNPPPVAGAAFVHSEGVEMKPFKTAGATTSAEDGRRMLLMVCAAVGMPESFFGDVSVGTLATAKSLDRPTELKFRDRQTLWGDVWIDILEFVIQNKIDAGQLPQDVDQTITAAFPPILEHDVKDLVTAIATAATLNGYAPAGTIDPEELARMLYTALGRENVDELLKKMNFQKQRDAADAELQQKIDGPPEPAAVPPGGRPQARSEAMLLEAVQKLRDGFAGVVERITALVERPAERLPAPDVNVSLKVDPPAAGATITRQVVLRGDDGLITEVKTVRGE